MTGFSGIVRARAPLRLGLAGGGTDVSPYCDLYGGAVLNVTISLYAYATIAPSPDGRVRFVATDLGADEVHEANSMYAVESGLQLHRGVYNRIVADFNQGRPLPLTLTTSVDSPLGSGLGSSSALTVAMVEAFRGLLELPLGDYDVAHLAFRIERLDVGMNGGRQDQYAATFGGVNFIEFAANDRVIVNPLSLRATVLHELESSTILFFTGASRKSSQIIDRQAAGVRGQNPKSIEAMHQLKREALELKAALLRGEFREFTDIYRRSWEAKKATAPEVTTAEIDRIYEMMIMSAGALGGKVSGAGGGGSMIFFVDPARRSEAIAALEATQGQVIRCGFVSHGATSWRIDSAGRQT
jgi:D-glycero-alpha-D-manno-heptose-7-phosphate kinase